MSRTDPTLGPARPTLLAALEDVLPERVSTRATDRLGHAHDASHYLLTPQAVVRAGELGMTPAAGHPYRHLLEHLAEATRP